MRKRLIAGNWKMNHHWNEAMSLVADLVQMEEAGAWNNADVAIIPPVCYARHSYEFLRNAKSAIQLGAQDCAQHENGAYTGDVSASMLSQLGVTCVLIGHSERRAYHRETDEILLSKLQQALNENLTPILCCGESLDERKSGKALDVVRKQLSETLGKLNEKQAESVVIAYEPVWAIGTGETATPQQAQEMHSFIRELLQELFGQSLSHDCRILYGGSMKPSNATELLAQPDVDGGLIGGASLDADQFNAIITA